VIILFYYFAWAIFLFKLLILFVLLENGLLLCLFWTNMSFPFVSLFSRIVFSNSKTDQDSPFLRLFFSFKTIGVSGFPFSNLPSFCSVKDWTFPLNIYWDILHCYFGWNNLRPKSKVSHYARKLSYLPCDYKLNPPHWTYVWILFFRTQISAFDHVQLILSFLS